MRALLLIGAMIALAMALLTGLERWRFARDAVPMQGQVVEVTARDSRCGRRPSRACTRFTATVAYAVQGSMRQLSLGAGQSRGHDEPVSDARYRPGDRIALRVHPRTGEAYADATTAVWGLPMLLALVGGLMAAFGVFRPRRA